MPIVDPKEPEGEAKSPTGPKSRAGENVPFGTRHDVVKVFSAFLAEILVRTRFLLHDANAAAVLPDLADIALNEKTTQIIARHFRISQASLGGVRRQARVFQVAAYAACDLVFLCYVVIEVVLKLCDVVFVVVLFACSSSGQGWFDLRVNGGLFGLF